MMSGVILLELWKICILGGKSFTFINHNILIADIRKFEANVLLAHFNLGFNTFTLTCKNGFSTINKEFQYYSPPFNLLSR